MRLGDLDALRKAFEEVYPLATNEMGGVANKRIYDIIDNAPTVEQEVYMTAKDYNLFLEGYKQGNKDFARPQGEWEEHGEYKLDNHYFKCSACGELEEETSNYCPNCGADMRGDKE